MSALDGRPAGPGDANEALVPFGWDGRLALLAEAAAAALRSGPAGEPDAWSPAGPGTGAPQPARILAIHRGQSVVRVAGGEVRATLARRLLQGRGGPAQLPAVGDWVLVTGSPPEPAVIRAILPRRSELRRQVHDAGRRAPSSVADEQVLAANVDLVIIADSFGAGPNLRRLERYVALAGSAGAEPVVLLNKADLASVDEVESARGRVASRAPGATVLAASVRSGEGVEAIRAHIGPGRTAVVLGPSGAGKSTLVNGLLGGERQATGAVREDDRRGRHTTTHRELFLLPGGGMVIDTPGIRSLELSAGEDDLDAAFEDVAAIAVACRFADCGHAGEPGCAVAAAIAAGTLDPARVEGARQLAEEARRRAPARSVGAAELKRRDKMLARAIRHHERLRGRDE